MSIRVNLLSADEFSQKSSVKVNISPHTVGLIVAVVSVTGLALAMLNFRQVTHGLTKARERWAALEPTYEEVTAIQLDKNANLDIESELNGWANSTIRWHTPLRAIAGLVPSDIQLTKLEVKGDVGKATRIDPSHQGAPPPPYRKYHIRLDGIARGEFSDQTVVNFVKTLQTEPAFRDWLESVKLQGLQKSVSAQSEDPNERVFRVDMQSKVREMK